MGIEYQGKIGVAYVEVNKFETIKALLGEK